MRRITITLAALVLFAGCRNGRESKPRAVAERAPTTAANSNAARKRNNAAERMSGDSPELLARQVADAQRGSFDGREDAFVAIRKQWRGRRHRWTMRFLPALCPSASQCHLLPFDHHRFEGRIVQGWLPRLTMPAAQHAQLVERCRGHERCVVSLEATMTELTLSTVEPTAVTLSNLRFVETREARANESWAVRPRS
jgi:hypothetical protein